MLDTKPIQIETNETNPQVKVKDVALTPEMAEKLKGFLAFEKEASFVYVPKIFRDVKNNIPKDFWVVFKLTTKDGIESAKAQDKIGFWDAERTKFTTTLGEYRIDILSSHIIGWKNFMDVKGNKIIFDKNSDGTVKESLIKLFPSDLQIELFEAINNQSKLSEEELMGLEF